MYIPKHFEQTSSSTLWNFIGENAFGTLLTIADGQPFVSHLPFLPDRDAGVLHCHMARANPQWHEVGRSPEVLVIFAGPHGYISPTWYAERGGVPTWNYAVVHAHGSAQVVDDPERTRTHVESLAATYERGRPTPWVPDYDTRRLDGIVGIDIRITKLEGKFKLSQNRSGEDQARIVAQLAVSGRGEDAALAELMASVLSPGQS